MSDRLKVLIAALFIGGGIYATIANSRLEKSPSLHPLPSATPNAVKMSATKQLAPTPVREVPVQSLEIPDGLLAADPIPTPSPQKQALASPPSLEMSIAAPGCLTKLPTDESATAYCRNREKADCEQQPYCSTYLNRCVSKLNAV